MSELRAVIEGLTVPVFAAPMFLVSGPELVTAACEAGIVGAFPAPNARTIDDLRSWVGHLDSQLTTGTSPWAVNVVAHRSYERLNAELDVLASVRPRIVITALGGPTAVVDAVHRWGGFVLADVSTVEHARKAVAAGVDGLVLVCAGAGGHTGRYSPFALVPAVRTFWDGPLVVGGAVSTGGAVAALRALGADAAYVGTRFLATNESLVADEYKQMVIDATLDDIVTSSAVTGVSGNWMRRSLERRGVDLAAVRQVDFSGDMSADTKAWRDVWSAGHGVDNIGAVESVATVVGRLGEEYRAACLALADTVPSQGADR